jgi:hypothetical protein
MRTFGRVRIQFTMRLRHLRLNSPKVVPGCVRTHPPNNPVGQHIDLLAIRPAHTTCNTVLYIGQAK